MTKPKEYYTKVIMPRVTDAKVRELVEIMADHVGIDNQIQLSELCERLNLDERGVRIAIAKLVNDYRVPVGAISGKAGRWIIQNEHEMNLVVNDLERRTASTNARIRNLRAIAIPELEPVAKVERVIEEKAPVQEYLFEPPKPKPWQLQYGEWR